MAGLQNCSLTTLDIKVVSNKGDEKVRSFGLGATAKERVMVEKTHLLLSNNGSQTIKLSVSIVEAERRKQPKKPLYKSFTLENKSAKSISLIRPSVMNPNLSPFQRAQ